MVIIFIMLMFSFIFKYLINFNKMFFFQNLLMLLFFFFFLFNKILFYSMKSYWNLNLDYLSFYLILLTLWIMSLMFISLIKLNFMNMYINNLMFLLLMLILAFYSNNYFMFYFFFESSMIPTFLLIIGWGSYNERIEASLYMIMYTLFASLPLMMILLKIFYENFSLNMFLLNNMNVINNIYMYIYMLLAFLVKLPMFLFHSWLPKAHVEAPITGSMILAGVMLKLGGYGLMRMILIIESINIKYNYILIILNLFGSLYMSLICFKQLDLKILVAYSSVVHMNSMISSILIFNNWSNFGSLMMMISHGLCSSGLFCLVNLIYERFYSRSLMLNKGLSNIFSSLSLFWFFGSIFNMGAPPSLNMYSEIFIFISLISWNINFYLILMFLMFFNVLYMMYFFSQTQHGKLNKNLNNFKSINIREFLLLILHFFPLIFLILIF